MVKAGAHDSEIVQALGIVAICACGVRVGTMLAALAGVIMAPLWGIRPHMGVDAVVPAFLIIVLGARRRFWGRCSAGSWSAWSCRPVGGLRVGVVDVVDVSPADRRREFPGPWSVWQEKRARGLEMNSARSVPVITVAMLVTGQSCKCSVMDREAWVNQHLGVDTDLRHLRARL